MYDAEFFDVIRDGCQRSAAAVAPIVDEIMSEHTARGRTLVDVGCGEGWWALAFEALGWRAVGIDGPDTLSQLERFIPHDLREPIEQRGRPHAYDLAVSLEVAEHLPPERAESFVADLCSFAPVVLFSAAIPGQGGTGHLNEQWPDYWVELFGRQGYAVSGALRWRIWDDDRVENWYRQNLMLCTNRPELWPDLFDGTPPISVVHPILYDARRTNAA